MSEASRTLHGQPAGLAVGPACAPLRLGWPASLSTCFATTLDCLLFLFQALTFKFGRDMACTVSGARQALPCAAPASLNKVQHIAAVPVCRQQRTSAISGVPRSSRLVAVASAAPMPSFGYGPQGGKLGIAAAADGSSPRPILHLTPCTSLPCLQAMRASRWSAAVVVAATQ